MGLFLCCTGIQQQQYSSSTYEYVVVQYQNREHTEQQSTTQHCAITPAQSSKPSTCRSEYASKEECTYMHASSGLFSWSMELLVFASRLFAPKMLHHLINTFACHFNPLFLVIERDVRNRPLREAPCTTYIYIPRTNLATYIPPANLPTSRFNSRRASRQTRPSHNHTRTLCFRLLASDLVWRIYEEDRRSIGYVECADHVRWPRCRVFVLPRRPAVTFSESESPYYFVGGLPCCTRRNVRPPVNGAAKMGDSNVANNVAGNVPTTSSTPW